MPAEHMKEEEEFEEDTLFDQAGLLTNQIKPRVDVCNVNGTMRITPMKTFALCLAFFGLGLSFAILEPTLLDLQQLAGADVQKISYTITARALGYILGSALGILLFDRYNRQFLLFLSMLSMMVLLGLLPWCHNLVAYILLLFLLGALMQMLYAGGNVLCLDLWGRQSGPFLQAIHFSLALGIFLAPLLCNAIMMGNTGVSGPDRPILLNFNSSQALALPASSLFGVHISSSGVYSRHRRDVSALTDVIPLNLNDTLTEAPILPVVADRNKSIENISEPTQIAPVLPNNTVFPTNSTSASSNTNSTNSTTTSEDRTGQMNLTAPEAQINATFPTTNVTDAAANGTMSVKPSHKPKPSFTDSKLLKNNPDPWDRNPNDPNKLAPVPAPTPATSSSTVTPTSTVQPQTNESSSNVSGTIANSTDVTPVNGSSLVFNGTSSVVMTSPFTNITSATTASTLLENTVLPPLSQTTNSSDNLGTHLVDSKDGTNDLTTDNSKLTATQLPTRWVTTSTVMTSTTSSTAATVATVHQDGSVAKSLEPSDITTTLESEQILGMMSNSDLLEKHKFTNGLTTLPTAVDHSALPEQHYSSIPDSSPTNSNVIIPPVVEVSTLNNEDMSESEITTSTEKVPVVTVGVVSSGLVNSPQRSTESNVILSEHTSTVSSSYSNGPVADSSEEGANVTVHHKPSTFNNQSEDSPQLLNDLLNRISEMGVTKVHIVYVVMSVIVLLTSLVFLSFLCHNPRELRSKQEEGVKPGVQEGKFTSIMVGLMFVMIIFYTGAELVFSQLYLSLVWQSSAHLLRSRGSLLISVFWGLYAFSRGTSICCTNGFRPVTMLLVDLVCCIISAGTLAIFGSEIESLLWCSVAVMAIGLSSILPYSLLWLEEYIHISNKTACILLMGGSVVNLVLSFMYGHPVTVSRSLVIYLVLTCCIFALLIYGIMWRLATWRGDKYGLNCKMDVRYQLASQVDEEEDSFELSSGNSSLYLLNNGNNQNGHTSWDLRTEPTMAYLPLKQKKTKWK